jgi:hypothetical protein
MLSLSQRFQLPAPRTGASRHSPPARSQLRCPEGRIDMGGIAFDGVGEKVDGKRAQSTSGFERITDSSQALRQVRKVQILLQKSAITQ